MFALNQLDFDSLKEVITIGAGHASTALSKLLCERVVISIPKIEIVSLNYLESQMLKKEGHISILLHLKGEITGAVVVIFNQPDAQKLVDLLKEKLGFEEVDNLHYLAPILEISNILTGASLTALSKFLQKKMLQSPPVILTEDFGPIRYHLQVNNHQLLLFTVQLTAVESNITGRLMFLFDPNSTKEILKVTGNLNTLNSE